MKTTKTQMLTLSALAVVINIVLGMTVSGLKIPLLFLDTLGTIAIAAIFGPSYGTMVGFVTNFMTSVIGGSFSSFPFALVSIAIGLIVGLIVGLIAKKYKKFDYKIALITGLIIAIVAPLIGTPISILLFGGLTGGGTDLMVAALLASGKAIFAASFITRIASNLVDKVLSCLIAAFVIDKYLKKRSTILKYSKAS
ncbi:CD3073 family putative ECF transporter S component [Proteocatella sphenisci]|uniref:CD3073 family putative ECF transporter S component n=1 Tax=Proteocatella sphenisci TaxID=181070 RepID=UPI000490FAC5|nr:CD3073 family putative ECF transporter S component [Proteocatella sphenisci]